MGSVEDGDGASLRWDDLAREVKRRREAMRLPQNLAGRNGPGEITVRKIERGEGASVQPRTWARLEAALAAREGWVDRILDGTADEDDLNVNSRFMRAGTARGVGRAFGAETRTGQHLYRALTDSAPARDTVTADVAPAGETIAAGNLADLIDPGTLAALRHIREVAASVRAAIPHLPTVDLPKVDLPKVDASTRALEAAGARAAEAVRAAGLDLDEKDSIESRPAQREPAVTLLGRGTLLTSGAKPVPLVERVTELIARLAQQPDRSPAAEDALQALHKLLPELFVIAPTESEDSTEAE